MNFDFSKTRHDLRAIHSAYTMLLPKLKSMVQSQSSTEEALSIIAMLEEKTQSLNTILKQLPRD